MEHVGDYSDERHKSWCIHCGHHITDLKTNMDHVPSKSLLEKPYPAELPTVQICQECNTSFSPDEEYFAAFLGAVLSGSTEPTSQSVGAAERIFRRNHSLRSRIENSRRDFTTIGGEKRTIWTPEDSRIRKAVTKNARGHIYYELGQPALADPDSVVVAPLETLADEQRKNFLDVDHGAGWPEVGSRMMTRLLTGHDLDGGWIIVQPGIYRFAATEDDGFIVKIIIREYLAAEVVWRV
jgi:hypothetical protein